MVVNKYNSLTQTFYATDLFNLQMPVVPPADLTILQTAFAPAYFFFRDAASAKVGLFQPNDNAYIRGLALNSNLADGLVFADTATGKVDNQPLKGWTVNLFPRCYDTPVTGCTNVAGSALITGAGFNSFFATGQVVMWLDDNGVAREGLIQSINGAGTQITLASPSSSGAGTMFAGNMASGKLYPTSKANLAGGINIPFLTMNTMNPYNYFAWSAPQVRTPVGTMSLPVGTATVTGVGTKFTTDFAGGDEISYVDIAGVRRTNLVLGMPTSDTVLTVQNLALGSAVNAPILNPNYGIAYQASIGSDFKAYTISIDPAYGAVGRRLSINMVAEIEYTFPIGLPF
jgi:hypothetical protein